MQDCEVWVPVSLTDQLTGSAGYFFKHDLMSYPT